MKTRVATSLIWPRICYILTDMGHKWVFAHPVFWDRKGLFWDLQIDYGGRAWRGRSPSKRTMFALELFYEYVWKSAVSINPSDMADEIIALGKVAAKERQRIESGTMEIF